LVISDIIMSVNLHNHSIVEALIATI
jgi:hypothetical protein